MLPYTTYNIPETPIQTPADSGKWLWIIVGPVLSEKDKELLAKISSALNADFNLHTHCLQLDIDQSISLAEADSFNPDLIISFGVLPSALGLWIDLHKSGIMPLERFTFILTSSLETLSTSASAKKDLWRNMQVYLETK